VPQKNRKQPKQPPPASPPATTPRVLVQSASKPLEVVDLQEALDRNGRGLSLTPHANLTPPGMAPLAGVAADNPADLDLLNELIFRARWAQHAESFAAGYEAGRQAGRAEVAGLDAAAEAPHPGMGRNHWHILFALAMRPRMPLTQEEIAGRLHESRVALSERTIGPCLKELREWGYTEQPNGTKGGEALTGRGLRLVEGNLPDGLRG
jgi:hypothetical protein